MFTNLLSNMTLESVVGKYTTFMLCDYDVLYQLRFRHSSYLARFLWSHSGICLKWCLCVYSSSYSDLQLEYTSFTPCILLQSVLGLWQKWLQAWTRNYSYRMIVGWQKLPCYSSENDTLLISKSRKGKQQSSSFSDGESTKESLLLTHPCTVLLHFPLSQLTKNIFLVRICTRNHGCPVTYGFKGPTTPFILPPSIDRLRPHFLEASYAYLCKLTADSWTATFNGQFTQLTSRWYWVPRSILEGSCSWQKLLANCYQPCFGTGLMKLIATEADKHSTFQS